MIDSGFMLIKDDLFINNILRRRKSIIKNKILNCVSGNLSYFQVKQSPHFEISIFLAVTGTEFFLCTVFLA
jgi:hypothetical protein